MLLEDKKTKQNDSWNFWFWFIWSKNGRFVTHIGFQQTCFAETPYLKVFLGAHFLAKLSKKGNWRPPSKRTFWLVIEKVHFLVLLSFLALLCFILILFLFLFLLFLFFGGLEGLRVR